MLMIYIRIFIMFVVCETNSPWNVLVTKKKSISYCKFSLCSQFKFQDINRTFYINVMYD